MTVSAARSVSGRAVRVSLLVAVVAALGLATVARAAPPASAFVPLWDDAIGSTNVMSIAQDRQGFLWLGTQGGLVRYDGYEFVVFGPHPEDPASIDDGFVGRVAVDSSGTIWTGTRAGVCRYVPETRGFVRYTGPEVAEDRRLGVTSIVEHGGRHIVGTEVGVYRIDPETRRLEPYPERAPEGPNAGLVSAVLSASDGTLWLGGSEGLLSQPRPDAPFERRAGPGGGLAVVDLLEDRSGRIWVRWSDGAIDVVERGRIRRLRGRSQRLAGVASTRQSLLQPSENEVWLATNDGIVVLDAATGETRDSVAFGTAVYSMFIDESGVVWAGVTGEGLVRYLPTSAAFRLEGEGMAVRSANAAAEVDGRIWIGTRGGGIYVWDPGDDALRHVDITNLTAPPNGGFVRDILALGDAVWVATSDQGVIAFDRQGNHRASFGTAQGLPSTHVFSLARLGDHEILVGTTDHGLGLIDVRRGTAGPAPFFDEGHASGRPPPILDLAVAGDRIYVGGGDGLWELARDGRTRTRYSLDPADPRSLSHDDVMALLVDRRERLWVGTRGGLDLLQRNADGSVSFRRFGVAQGLGNPFVDGLLEGTDGDIWAATGSGFSRVDGETLSITIYDRHDGVPSSGFWVGGHATAADGTLMFASKQGLLVVDPSVTRWTYQPQLAVTAVRIDGRPRPEAEGGVILTSSERDFSVEFAALDLSGPEANRYAVRLDGYDEQWVDASAARRVATYTNLDPGEYVLRVRGTNHAGLWSPHEIALSVVVQPGLTETTWFRALLVLTVPGLLFLAHRWRIRRLRAREQELESLVRQRTADLEDANQRLEHSSLTDFLTGLHNRRGFAEAADVEMRRWRRSRRPLCIAVCDLDDFKRVNDTHGHEVGDFVLRSFARILREELRDSDVAARWGGEEFVLLLPETDLAGGRRVAEKIAERMAGASWTLQQHTLTVTVTIGVSELTDGEDLDACVARADEALYSGKRAGKNRVVVAE